MAALTLAGFVALGFGLASFQILEEWSLYNGANLAFAAGALGLAALRALRRTRALRPGAESGPALEAFLMAIALSWAAALAVGFASAAGTRFDWTFEGRYQLAPATLALLAGLEEPLELTLYTVEGDPRRRATHLLLEELARNGDVTVRGRDLDLSPEDEDRYGIASSNTVVARYAGHWGRVDRPTEGALYETLSTLARPRTQVLYVGGGSGDGDIERSDDRGFSGLRAALETEGYQVRPLRTAVIDAIPEDADALLLLAPERRLPEPALAAVSDYLAGGGTLVALLEPGRESGVEEILARYGLTPADGVVVDPNAGSVDGRPAGLDPTAFHYGEHPATEGLNANRMTFFSGARSFGLRKPEPDDRLASLVFTTGDAWLHDSPDILTRSTLPARPASTRGEYLPLAVAGHYERDGTHTRIVAVGDTDFASNRYLRTLYNLDLALNLTHWALTREPAITIRPKIGNTLQFPVPIQSTLNALYGVGLLVPQLLVTAGVLTWRRRRQG